MIKIKAKKDAVKLALEGSVADLTAEYLAVMVCTAGKFCEFQEEKLGVPKKMCATALMSALEEGLNERWK